MTNVSARRLVAALALLAGLSAACTPPPTGGGGGPTVLSVGHVDAVEISLDGNALRMLIEDETNGVTYREPTQTILHVKPESATTVPNLPQFSFLGAPGSTAYILPEVQNSNLLWPGSSTERIGPGELAGNTVTWTVQSVSGPGGFHVYQSGVFGNPNLLFSTQSAFPQSRQLNVPSHAHYNWAFSTPGTYTVVMRANATIAATATPVMSGNVTYTFRVGPL